MHAHEHEVVTIHMRGFEGTNSHGQQMPPGHSPYTKWWGSTESA